MNADQLTSRILSTDSEDKPFIPGYSKKSILMEKFLLTLLSAFMSSLRAWITFLLQWKGPPLFLSQMTAAQIKEVGLSQAPGKVSSLIIKDELPAFSSLLLSCDSKETGIAQNALARVKEMLYDSIINAIAWGHDIIYALSSQQQRSLGFDTSKQKSV